MWKSSFPVHVVVGMAGDKFACSTNSTAGSYWSSSGRSFTAGAAGIEFRYAQISRKSESGITFSLNVGMELAGGWRTIAINAAIGIGFGASLRPAPPCPQEEPIEESKSTDSQISRGNWRRDWRRSIRSPKA